MIIISPSFQESELIPQKFSCKGDPASAGINPELEIENVPEGAKALVLIMVDRDATRGRGSRRPEEAATGELRRGVERRGL